MRNIIMTAIVTILVMITGYFAYTVIKLQSQVALNTTTLSQIVNFLNSQIKSPEPVK